MRDLVRAGCSHLVAVLTFAVLLELSASNAQAQGQGLSAGGAQAVPTRGYSGGGITFATAPARSWPTTPYTAAPVTSADGTTIITSHGVYDTGAPPAALPPPPPPSRTPLPLAASPPPARSSTPSAAAATVVEAAPAAGAPRSTDGGYGQGFFSEARIGASLHDIGAFSGSDEGGIDVDLELLFGSPAFLSYIGAPRPHIGGKINTSGDTSLGYFGLTWDWLAQGWFIVEAALGGAVHTGDLNEDTEKDLGCRLLFRGAVGVGAQFAERHRVLVTFDSANNLGICSDFQSLDGLGIRYGFLF